MKVQIDKNSNMNINEQIRYQLKYQIINGQLSKNQRLPSVRDMASILNVNRHTINKAYKDLEQEGYIVTKKSLGTFVSDGFVPMEHSEVEVLNQAMNEIANKAVSLGFSISEFLSIARYHYSSSTESKNISALFIECNESAKKQFVNDLKNELKIDIDGCLISDLENGAISGKSLNDYDLIITVAGHYPYVKSLLKSYGDKLYAINLGPYLRVLNDIGKLPSACRLGIVCIRLSSGIGLKNIMTELGDKHSNIVVESTENEQAVVELCKNVDYLVVSKYALAEYPQLFRGSESKIIEFTNKLETTSVMMIKDVVNCLKEQ